MVENSFYLRGAGGVLANPLDLKGAGGGGSASSAAAGGPVGWGELLITGTGPGGSIRFRSCCGDLRTGTGPGGSVRVPPGGVRAVIVEGLDQSLGPGGVLAVRVERLISSPGARRVGDVGGAVNGDPFPSSSHHADTWSRPCSAAARRGRVDVVGLCGESRGLSV